MLKMVVDFDVFVHFSVLLFTNFHSGSKISSVVLEMKIAVLNFLVFVFNFHKRTNDWMAISVDKKLLEKIS